MDADLRQQCHTFIAGNHEPDPATLFRQMADWCQEHDAVHDAYGEGKTIQNFEQQVAELLGFEAALFVITGTLTQPTALQLVCREKRCSVVAMHETCHIFAHEAQGYQMQQRFQVLPVGDRHRPWNVKDLKAWPDEIAAAVYELPMREIGGQLPSWQQLEEVKTYCAEQGIHLHMDGARLWESAAYYQKSYRDIAKGFSTAYVSLYKGVNGLGGSMLLGSKAFIQKAAVWMRRQGGNVYHRTPYVVSAAMQFEQRLAMMPALYERTQQVYQILLEYPEFVLNPIEPQANMLHLYLPLSVDNAIVLRNRLASDKKIWLGNPQSAPQPNQCFIEWYVGDRLLNMPDHQLIEVLDWVREQLSQ
ncbi:threonine aldolase family protein [Vibrio fluvialis]|uniref:threonine aldolase family protein n=1 Tax=Vibrio fluvialis TaxID=676 RepID=UPI001EEB7088|nr:beta-eliminating lyase-related protein [Vibrio fluvialis]MCG6362784.1 beta-eliminating lyase-related protein [Vibrio fluvialis]